MEVLLRSRLPPPPNFIISVSILVLMEVLLRFKAGVTMQSEIVVSILVLMEVLLRWTSKKLKKEDVMCFNPCFNGSSS